MGVLTIYLDKVSNLTNKDLGTGSDPYVRFEMEQDNFVGDKDYGFQKSSTKHDDFNPTYGETFHFTIPTLNNMVLTCKIMDDDVGRDDKLGKCKIKLENLGLSETPMEVEKVIDRNIISDSGKIYLKLSYKE